MLRRASSSSSAITRRASCWVTGAARHVSTSPSSFTTTTDNGKHKTTTIRTKIGDLHPDLVNSIRADIADQIMRKGSITITLNKSTLLQSYIAQGHIESVREILDLEPSLVNAPISSPSAAMSSASSADARLMKLRPVDVAVLYNRVAVLRELLSRGAFYSTAEGIADNRFPTPLFAWAASSLEHASNPVFADADSAEVPRMLQEAGFDPNAVDESGNAACLHVLALHGTDEDVERFMKLKSVNLDPSLAGEHHHSVLMMAGAAGRASLARHIVNECERDAPEKRRAIINRRALHTHATALEFAVYAGEVAAAREILTGVEGDELDLHSADPARISLLTGAAGAAKNSGEMVQMLLRDKRIEAAITDRRMLLHLAAQQHDASVMKVLLSPEFSSKFLPVINDADGVTGSSALLAASATGSVECCRMLLAIPDILVNAENNEGFDALGATVHGAHVLMLLHQQQELAELVSPATSADCVECMRLLLAHPGIDPNHAHTPALCLAAEHGIVESAKLLLAHPGINPAQGQRPLATSRHQQQQQQQHDDINNSKSNNKNKNTNDKSNNNNNNNKNNNNKNTPAYLCACHRRPESVEILGLLRAANAECLNLVDPSDWRPIHAAVHANNVEVAAFLLRNGCASPSEVGHDGATPLLIVCTNPEERSEMLQLLLKEFHVDPNKDRMKTTSATPLQVAASFAHHLTVRALIEAKADVDAQSEDADGSHVTALYIAAGAGRLDNVTELLDVGEADVNIKCGSKHRAIDAAAYAGSVPVIEKLLAAGARTDWRVVMAAFSGGRAGWRSAAALPTHGIGKPPLSALWPPLRAVMKGLAAVFAPK